jgi:hypothetical protein
MVWYLHIGIFVVWIPAILVSSRTTKDFKQKDFWKAALRGCPPWMKHLTYLFGGYAIINFLIFIYLERSGTGHGENDLIKLRGFSGHWMAFYSAAMSTLYSATQIEKFDRQRRCRNGHPVSPLAKFCEECGASVLDLNIK